MRWPRRTIPARGEKAELTSESDVYKGGGDTSVLTMRTKKRYPDAGETRGSVGIFSWVLCQKMVCIVLPGQMNNDGIDCYEIQLGKLVIVGLRSKLLFAPFF